MNTIEWAVECGYISLLTNAIRGEAKEGKEAFQRKFGGDVEAFRRFCREKQAQAEQAGRHDTAAYIGQCLDDLKVARTRFPLPDHPGDTPLVEHPFYAWLVANEDRLDTRHHEILSQYLDHLGFDIERHTLEEAGLRTLHHVMEMYGLLWMPTRTPQRLDALFVPLGPQHPHTYWLRGGERHGLGTDRVGLSDTLKGLIDQAAPIYPLEPGHYYFEVIHRTLFLSYQHIIGHRRLCSVKEAV